jgi:capsid portal protein
MDRRNGAYIGDRETLDIEFQANEILEFPLGVVPYGEVRWMGQVLGVDGSRKAERLNNNYFKNGRHTPLMIIIRNGTLTDSSFEKLQGYMDEIKGENGQHAFLLLEAEGSDGRTDFDQAETPNIEIKDLANILQKDELFQEYMNNNRRKVQSAFQLPDLYVGYTTDFNRATAQTAQEVTEEQVFQPERISLAWIINNKLLNGYQFKHVEVYFKEPNMTNPDDIYKILSVCSRAGGLTPNKAKEIIYAAYGEVSEDYDGDWGNIPVGIQAEGGMEKEPEIDVARITMSLEQQIRKAASEHDDAIVAVMKEVRDFLVQNNKKGLQFGEDCGILKWNKDQPRDESGRFASTGGGKNKKSGSRKQNKPTPYTFSSKPPKGFMKKTYYLPDDEYAKVVSAIDDAYHIRYEGKERGLIQVPLDDGYHDYHFEISDYNNYNIYKRD